MSDQLPINTNEAVENVSKLEKSVLDLLNALEQTEIQAKDLNNSFKSGKLSEFNKAQKESLDIQNKLANNLVKVERLRQEEQKTLQQLARTQVINNKETDRQVDRSTRLTKAKERENKQTETQIKRTTEANRAFKKLEAELLKATKSYQDMARSEGFASTKTKALLNDVKRLRSEVDKIQKPIGNFQRNVGNYGSALSGLGNVAGALGIVGVADTIIRIGESAFDTTRKLDSMNNAMLAVFETQEEVSKQNVFLVDIADRYGLELITLTESYKSFSAAVKGTNLEGEKSQRIFDTVTKTSAQLGLTTEQTEGALRALEQMISKGTVQAEELRGQLGERIPGAFRIFAEGLGVTTEELNKMLEKGEVLAEDTLPKFADALEKAYNLENVTRIETLNGAVNRLKNTFTLTIAEINETGAVSSVLTGYMTSLNEQIELIKDLFREFAGVGKDVNELMNVFTDILKDLGIEIENNVSLFQLFTLTTQLILAPVKDFLKLVRFVIQSIKSLVEVIQDLINSTPELKAGLTLLLHPISQLMNGFNDVGKSISGMSEKNKKAMQSMRGEITDTLILLNSLTSNPKPFGGIESPKNNLPFDFGSTIDTRPTKIIEAEQKARLKAEKEAEKARKKEEIDLKQRIEMLMSKARDLAEINEVLRDSTQQINKESFKYKLEDLIGKDATDKIFSDAIKNAEEFGVSFNQAFANSMESNKGLIDNVFKELIKPNKADIKQVRTVFSESFERLLPDFKGKESDGLLLELGIELETMSATEQLEEFESKIKEVVESESFKSLEGEQLDIFIERTKQAREELEKFSEKEKSLLAIRDVIADGLSNLGLGSVVDEFTTFFDSILDKSNDFAQDFVAGLSFALATASELLEMQSENRLDSLERENEKFQEDTDLKIEAIERQLDAENLSVEEREALNAQIEVFESQKLDKEKQTKTKQFKAQQKADAQQALINGALGATQTIARLGVPFGLVPAGISLAFGAVQSALILSKPVPEFYKGTDNAPEGYALTQERGSEIITDKKGNIKTLGNDKGAQMTYLNKGDKVYTSSETNDLLQSINTDVLDDGLMNSMILNKLIAPKIEVNNKGITKDDMYSVMDRIHSKYNTPTYFNDGKTLFVQSSGKYPKEVKKMSQQKNNSSNRSKFN